MWIRKVIAAVSQTGNNVFNAAVVIPIQNRCTDLCNYEQRGVYEKTCSIVEGFTADVWVKQISSSIV